MGIINSDVCPLTLPAASLLGTPYAHSFDADPIMNINSGDLVQMQLSDRKTTIKVISRNGEER